MQLFSTVKQQIDVYWNSDVQILMRIRVLRLRRNVDNIVSKFEK